MRQHWRWTHPRNANSIGNRCWNLINCHLSWWRRYPSFTGGWNRHFDVKLSKLELPMFGGNPVEWTGFGGNFSLVIDQFELPHVTKFTYLVSLLKGKAKSAESDLSLSAKPYKDVCDILQKRFRQPEHIAFTHKQDLLNINVPHQTKVSSLWGLVDTLQVPYPWPWGIGNHVWSVQGDTPIILSRLPSKLCLEWARIGEGHEWDLLFLINFYKMRFNIWKDRRPTRTLQLSSRIVFHGQSAGTWRIV